MGYKPGDWEDVPDVAGMTPWACEYDGPDGRYGITLYGTDPNQILEDHCEALPGLTVEGKMIATAPAIWVED